MGRPRTVTSTRMRKKIIEVFEDELYEDWLKVLKESIQKKDGNMVRWIGDQVIGRAPQHVELEGNVNNTNYEIIRKVVDPSVVTTSQPEQGIGGQE